jgi:hypothetical protein
MLPHQDFGTPEWAVIEEYEAVVKWLAREHASKHWKISSSATSFTTNLTWSHSRQNPILLDEKPAPNRLSYGMVIFTWLS